MLRNIHFYGSAKELVGTDTIKLDVDTPVMLYTALRSQVPGFRSYCSDTKLATVLTDSSKDSAMSLSQEDFTFTLGSATDIHILPETEGGGLETAAAIAAWAGATGTALTVATYVVFVAINLAVSFALGAISQALAGSPSQDGASTKANEKPSFIYNGPINVMEQGYPVPVVYGIHMTGSVVISAGVSVEEIEYETADPPAPSQPASPPAEEWQWNSMGGD